MKRIYFILTALCICIFASAQSMKVETFDKNTWNWTEGADKFQSVSIEDGYLVIQNLKKNKKATPYQQLAKSYAKLPLRPNESFKLTIKYLVANYYTTAYWIFFNTSKQCLEEDVELFESYVLAAFGSWWTLVLNEGQKQEGKLPGKVKAKGEYPMEFVLRKQGRISTIELNGIQLYEGELKMTNSCIGFQVPLIAAKNSYIKIDEVIIEQADADED